MRFSGSGGRRGRSAPVYGLSSADAAASRALREPPHSAGLGARAWLLGERCAGECAPGRAGLGKPLPMAHLREIPPPHDALLLLCRKCGKKTGGLGALRKALKRALGKGVRVAQSSCLDVCPKARICAVASGAGADRYLLLDPATAPEQLAASVRGLLGGEGT